MILRETLIYFIVISILCNTEADGDRWSRQVLNSEWIPLANPRSSQRNQKPVPADSAVQAAGQVPALSLPPALQQQYQDQLLQLQKTQESIQRLLLLQQQLKAQQQILQSQAYQPNGFVNAEGDKQALHQSTIVNIQTLPELAPEVLVPPVPSSEALPPIYRSQSFHSGESELKRQHGHRDQSTVANSPASPEQDYRQSYEESVPGGTTRSREENEKDYRVRQKSRYESPQKLKNEPSHVNFVTPATSTSQEGGEEQEEIQLVYVPAETLAQRGQGKIYRPQSRKHHSNRYHQHQEDAPSTTISSHDAYAREILQQIQRQHDEKNQYLNAERQKEIARLHAEQRELERQARIHQEVVRREEQLQRQREAEKKRKEEELIEEAARQRELQKIQERREKERLEKQKLELKAREEERRGELESLTAYQKENELRRQKEYEQSREQQGLVEVEPNSYEIGNSQAQPLVKESQLHHQHLTEVTSKHVKGSRAKNKQRNNLHRYQSQQAEFQDSAEVTTPSPNQPPLSVYMGSSSSDQSRVQLSDVLKTLKSARTISVLDNFDADIPRVFVGPRNLDPPPGYVKFDLPYLSSIENNRIERKVDKLPFFVAPLSFEPPSGYSKIPFPAPHIGSVVINSLENLETKSLENSSLLKNQTPLIEPNSYFVSKQPLPAYGVSTPSLYSQESNTAKYELSSLPPSQSTTKWRFSEFFDSKTTTEIPSAVTAASYNEERTSTGKFERPSKNRNYYNTNDVSTTPNYYSPKTITSFSFEQTIPQSTPSYQENTRHHKIDSQLIQQNVDHHQQPLNHFHNPEVYQQTNQRYPVDPTGQTVKNSYFLNPSSSLEEQAQYNLPAELPAISPQLPGLVNALVEKAEISSSLQTTIPPTPITTSTTTETPTTTYRPRTRHRGRITATRATTLSPPSRGNSERTRRPISRSRSKYTTTTEVYRDTSYDLTRRNSVTTSKYDDQDSYSKRPIVQENFKSREDESKESTQTQINDSSTSNEQGQNLRDFENGPAIESVSSNLSVQPSSASVSDSNGPVYHKDDYSASTFASVENFPHREVSISDSILPLSSVEYTRKSTHAPSFPGSAGFDEPINGFNFKSNEDTSSQFSKEFSFFKPVKSESVLFEPLAPTDSPNVQKSELQDFSPVYHHVSTQFDKNETPRPVYRKKTTSSTSSEEEKPLFLPIPQNKQEDFAFETTVTQAIPEITTSPTTTTTTTTTTTEAPVIIRQRVRGRLSGRTEHHQPDSAIQTRPRGSQDEYVRFSAVNQESPRTRHRTRTRTRTQSGQQRNSPIQTDGQEYVRIQSAPNQQQRRLTTSTSTTQTTPKATEEQQINENGEEDYGFIRTPNYRPVQQVNYKTTQEQNTDVSETTPSAEEIQSQAQILKNRQKYYSATRRPSTTRFTTTPRSDDIAYTVRPRIRVQSEETKTTKVRSRLRRPGARKRTTTTTTESAYDVNNELPQDENYPRVLPQTIQDAATHTHDLTDENYPQEFLLNYGVTPNFRREEYDQAQLASDSTRRQLSSSTSSTRARPTTSRLLSNSDIYGAESQWSTKLTGNSFQPSSYNPNQPSVDTPDKISDSFLNHGKNPIMPEIITAGPEVPTVTVLVSSDDGVAETNNEQSQNRSSSSEESIMDSMINTMVHFGKKMNAVEENNDNPTTTLENQTEIPIENSTEPEINKTSSATFKKAGLRRRRVRVRVRPAGAGSEDFVTAESQSYDSSLNQLPRQSQKFRNFFVTTQPTTTAIIKTSSTTTESPKTEKSVFETFLNKMLGETEESATTIAPEVETTSTTSPAISLEDAWTSVPTIIPSEINQDESSKSKDTSNSMINLHQTTEYSTTTGFKDDEFKSTEVPATTMSLIDGTNTYFPSQSTVTGSSVTSQNSDDFKNNSGENVIQSLNQESSLRYFVTKSPAFNEYLRSQEKFKKVEMIEDNPNYPKNHRSKWSEVRYPTDKSLFDYVKWNSKPQNHTEETGNNQDKQNNTELDNSSVTDYVKAIFESIKSADEEHHQNTKLADEIISLSARQEKELLNTEATTSFPTEVKTSVSSSSRVVTQPTVVSLTSSQLGSDSATMITMDTATIGPFVPAMMSNNQVKKTGLETSLGKVLRTTTTTKVSHMTEICYRGRCVMSKPKKEGPSR